MKCRYATPIGLPDPDSPCGLREHCNCEEVAAYLQHVSEVVAAEGGSISLKSTTPAKISLPRAYVYNKPKTPIELPTAKISWLCRLGFHKGRETIYAGAIACGYVPCKRCGV